MEVKIVEVTEKNFDQIPRPANKRFNCQECFYWIGKQDGRLDLCQQKKAWLRKKSKKYGSLAKLALWGRREKPVGFIQFGPINEFQTAELLYRDRLAIPRAGWCITCLAIQSSYRGKGVAKRLVSNVLADLKRRGVRVVDSYPWRKPVSWNQVSLPAPEFFQKLGFEIVANESERPIVRKRL